MRRFLLALLFLSLASPLRAEEDKPTALAIFDAALAQFEGSRVALRKWQYHQTLTTHQLDGAGKVVAKGTWKSIVRPGDPRPLEYIRESMEGKLSFFKAGAEEAGPAGASATPQPQKTRVSRKKIRPNRRRRGAEDTFADAISGTPADENVAGEGAYVIAFETKPKQNNTVREETFFRLGR